jgi:hypothetical protein
MILETVAIPVRIKLFTLIRIQIRILLLIKGMRICEHWSTEPRRLHLGLQDSIVSVHGSPRLHFEPLKLLNFDFNAYPDPQP